MRIAMPASTMPIIQPGLRVRNSEMPPAARAMIALTETLMTIWVNPSASGWVSTSSATNLIVFCDRTDPDQLEALKDHGVVDWNSL